MAKSDVATDDGGGMGGGGGGGGGRGATMASEEVTRRELRRLAKAIADDDFRPDILEKAASAIASFRARARVTNAAGGTAVKKVVPPATLPDWCLCPISGEVMRDPVVVATGQTYDRAFIEAWLNAGNRTCPKTQQVLAHMILTPNRLAARVIADWCRHNGVELPAVPSPGGEVDGLAATRSDRARLDGILERMSTPSSPTAITEQKKAAARELRQLTKRQPSFRALLGDTPGAIGFLLGLLSSPELERHPELREDLVTVILNLSIHDSNKRLVGDDPRAIPLLIDALRVGTAESRGNAAAALFTLSALDDVKLRIGEHGAVGPLLTLFESGTTPAARKDAASALFNVLMPHQNRDRAVREGAVQVLLKAVVERSLANEALSLLALLASSQDAVEEMCTEGAARCMLDVMRDGAGVCGRSKENAVVVLFSLCMYDRMNLRAVREEESCSSCVSWLAQNGTSRARRKAAGILERLNRSSRSSSSCGTP